MQYAGMYVNDLRLCTMYFDSTVHALHTDPCPNLGGYFSGYHTCSPRQKESHSLVSAVFYSNCPFRVLLPPTSHRSFHSAKSSKLEVGMACLKLSLLSSD